MGSDLGERSGSEWRVNGGVNGESSGSRLGVL